MEIHLPEQGSRLEERGKVVKQLGTYTQKEIWLQHIPNRLYKNY